MVEEYSRLKRTSMKIIKKIENKQDFYNYPTPTIAFLGDSVTHGCFECYEK